MCSADHGILPELCSPLYAITRALMTNTQLTDSTNDCARQARPTLSTSRFKKVQWSPLSERRSGFLGLPVTRTMVYLSAQLRRPLQMDNPCLAPGPSAQSNQQLEDLVRTCKSAIEARIDCKLRSDHPLLRWIVEHAANVYNKYAVSPEGKTPYASLHGKKPKEKLVEFGERVLWHVPKRPRTKLDLRWRLGIDIGYATLSNEYDLALPNGNVVKSNSRVRSYQLVVGIISRPWLCKTLLGNSQCPMTLTMSH